MLLSVRIFGRLGIKREGRALEDDSMDGCRMGRHVSLSNLLGAQEVDCGQDWDEKKPTKKNTRECRGQGDDSRASLSCT